MAPHPTTFSTIVVALLCFCVIRMTASSSVSQLSYKAVTSRDFPSNLNQHRTPKPVSSLIFCTTLCARDPHCRAIYLKEVAPDGLTCFMYTDQVLDLHFLTPGTGTYAYFTAFTSTATPQSYSTATVLYTTWYEPQDTLVAVYSFSSGSASYTTVSVLFNRDEYAYPQLSTICAENMHQAIGLSSSMVRIEEDPENFFTLHVICQDGESKQGDVTCDSSGDWVIGGSYGVACLSNQCYRTNKAGFAQYNGEAKNTRYGTGCSQWSNYYYYSDSYFQLDGYSKANAENYCRDPNGFGRPWCKIGSYMDYCSNSVKRCNWQP